MGLPTRILANVHARERATKVRRWVWALGTAAVALVIVVALPAPRRRPAPVPPAPQAMAGKPEPTRAEGQQVRRVTAEHRRPAQFPTPTPLTEQEKLLLLYLQSTPSSELQAQAAQPPMTDLEIPKISIAALEIKPLPGAENGQEN